MSLRVLLLLASLVPAAARADNEADDGICRNGGFTMQHRTLALARVVGAPRLYLLADTDGCPAKGEPACRQGRYVVTGDTLITGGDQSGYRCVLYPNAVGGTAGWVATTRLQARPLPAPTLQDWAGDWRDGDDQLRISVRGGQLQVEGHAYWPSANPTPQERPYGPNLGHVEALAVPTGDSVMFQDSSCTLRAQWLGNYLVVSDNSQCGGMNVRFNGVYQRAPLKR